MHVRALVERDLLALEVGDGLDRAVLRDEDRLAAGGRRLVRHVEQRSAGGLSEDRRRFTGIAEVDGADVHRFEQLRPAKNYLPYRLQKIGCK